MKTMFQIKWKLLVTYLVVAAVSLSVVIVIARQLTINIYGRHVSSMQDGSMGDMMPRLSTMASLDQAIRDALNTAMVWGTLIAVGVAAIISLIISRRITKPIHAMAEVTGKIAEGDYSMRVAARSNDEIGSLAESLNRMAVNLEEAQRLRRELMANIAHELRTPLTSISGYMEGLSDGVVPATPETYDLVHREADRLSRLVNDLQRLSRAESGKEKLDLIDLPVPSFLERLARRMEPQFREKGVALSIEVEPEIPKLLADEDKLDQVLINLLDNGLRYTDAGGKVTLAVRKQGDRIAITVADNGIGIAAADLPHIFERFYRADKSRSREHGGTGIGLTIAKRYVEALDGTIAAESRPGEGTRFTLLLPSSS
jgi:signal transduction histidine kinase